MRPHRRGKRPIARWVVAGLAVSAVTAMGAYGAAPNSPSAGAGPRSTKDCGTRPALPDPCKNLAALKTVTLDESRTICLTKGADTKTVPGGKNHSAIAVFGLGGNDLIKATNGAADIHGGTGKDTAYIGTERYTTWGSDTERVYDKSGRRIQSAASASAPTPFVPPKEPGRDVFPYDPGVRCAAGYDDGSYQIRFTTIPTLRAFNAIAGTVEFQKVAFAAAIYQWDATRKDWIQRGGAGSFVSYWNPAEGWTPLESTSTPWYWDETYDRDWTTFPSHNFWRTYDTAAPASVWLFHIPASNPGYYRVKLAFHWYGAQQKSRTTGQTVAVPDYDWEQWVPFHDDHSNNQTAGYPKDSYCAFGVDPSGGP